MPQGAEVTQKLSQRKSGPEPLLIQPHASAPKDNSACIHSLKDNYRFGLGGRFSNSCRFKRTPWTMRFKSHSNVF